MSTMTGNLKASLSPEAYYATNLKGTWGKPTGNGWHRWSGLCPFHQDRRAGSFVINRTTGAFKCFSCDAGGGDIIDFHMKFNHMHFTEALSQLQGIPNA